MRKTLNQTILREANGLKVQKLKVNKSNPVLGFSDSETVKLDLDKVTFAFAKKWALRAMKHFRLRGFLILRSSRNCYHVLFDRRVSWRRNIAITAWVVLLSHNKGLLEWFVTQCIKGCSTLRVSSKKEKPPPIIVFRFGKQNENIQDFLKYREIMKKIRARERLRLFLEI
jgi:hypothetical protein